MKIPNFECKEGYFSSWTQAKTNSYTTKDGLKLEKVPYPQLNLLLNANDTSPAYHYTELVAYLQQNPLKSSVYIHSASVYSVLLIAAATSENVSITISHGYSEKYLVLTSFVLNNIRGKANFEDESETKANLDETELIVTTSAEYAKTLPRNKEVLLIVEKTSKNPSKETLSKIEADKNCKGVKLTQDKRDQLSQGVY